MKNRIRKSMVVFDMDNTLLRGRFIDTCADRFNFSQALRLLRQIDHNPISLTVRIASFLHGKKKQELLAIADGIPLVDDTIDVIRELKLRGKRVGIISDSYQFVTDFIAEKINADFSMANKLQFDKGVATGEVLIPSFFQFSESSLCRHQVCKSNALLHACSRYKIEVKDCTVIGDSDNDVCMMRNAGVGIAFGSGSELMKEVAAKHIQNNSFSELLTNINQ